jgi:hypothetical protein
LLRWAVPGEAGFLGQIQTEISGEEESVEPAESLFLETPRNGIVPN